jgi:hypothetical protein
MVSAAESTCKTLDWNFHRRVPGATSYSKFNWDYFNDISAATDPMA